MGVFVSGAAEVDEDTVRAVDICVSVVGPSPQQFSSWPWLPSALARP